MQIKYYIIREENMLIEISKIFKMIKKDYERIKKIYDNKNKSSILINLKCYYKTSGVKEN